MHRYILLLFLLIHLGAEAEGTKDLMPNNNSRTFATLRPNDPVYGTAFGTYGADGPDQIKLYIKDTSETIYLGMSNRISNGERNSGAFLPNVPFRVLSPNGTILYESVMPENGEEGFIRRYNQAVAGPMEVVGADGYDAIELRPDTTGDFIIEFNPSLDLDLDLFDFSVADSTNTIVDGRLHCQGWQLRTLGFANPFYGKVYPYHPDGIVYEVDFNEIRPAGFIINFNSYGLFRNADFFESRKSRPLNGTFPEFEVFLNPPDSTVYPRVKREINFNTTVKNENCEQNEICINVSTNAPGEVQGFIDFNNNGILDLALGEISLNGLVSENDTACFKWDGRDSNGDRVNTRDLQIVTSFGYGVTHLPMFDVENNENGFKVRVFSPEGIPDPVLYWDDSEIAGRGTALDGLVNLAGCDSPSGCHRWQDRGDNNSDSETINTWWYSQVQKDTIVFQNVWNRPVDLTFYPDSIDQEPRSVCEGDSVPFYIFDDGFHYDTSFYTYEWYDGGQLLVTDTNSLTIAVDQTSNIRVRARDKSALSCQSVSLLEVSTEKPVNIDVSIVDELCSDAERTIDVNIAESPPDPLVTWQEFPGNESLSLGMLDTGVYHLTIADTNYSTRCALDTSFHIKGYPGIKIDTLITDSSFCYTSSGRATVVMESGFRDYEYSWDAGAYVKDSTITGLVVANHTVNVRDLTYGCEDDSTFSIFSKELYFDANSRDELCGDGNGSIELMIPNLPFDITWSDGAKTKIRNNLSEGNFSVLVVSAKDNNCRFDTTLTIQDSVRTIPLEEIVVASSDCASKSGSAEIIMEENDFTYLFSWQNGPRVYDHTFQNIGVGDYTVVINEEGTQCSLDTNVNIPGDDFTFNTKKTDDLCNSGSGSAEVIVDDKNVEISWAGRSDQDLNLQGLNEGTYAFLLVNPLDETNCRRTGSIHVNNEETDLEADFSYYSLVSGFELEVGDVIQFENRSTGFIEKYTWDFADGNRSDLINPEHVYNEINEYNVSLEIKDVYGCVSRKTELIYLGEPIPCSAALPNAFSPNRDRINDNIGPLGEISEVDLRIFNRWGEAVYRGYSKDDRWDGTYRGEEAPVGTYPYILEYSCPDERGNMIRQKEVGDISLIR